MTRFCPRTTGSLHPQPLWTAAHHQGVGAPGHHHPQGHQLHPIPFIPHTSTAYTPLCSIPLNAGPSCPMDPQSVPLYIPKYPAPSYSPVLHTQPHIPHTLLHPAPWTDRLCPYVSPNPCSAPSCPISLKTLLHPAPVYPHNLLNPSHFQTLPLCTPISCSIQPYTLAHPLHPAQLSDPSRSPPASSPSECSSDTSRAISVRSQLSSQK